MTKIHDVTLDTRISKEQAQHLFLLDLDNIKRLYADQSLSELEKVLFERIQVSLDEREEFKTILADHEIDIEHLEYNLNTIGERISDLKIDLDNSRDEVSDLYSKLDLQAVTIEGLENEIITLTDTLEANHV